MKKYLLVSLAVLLTASFAWTEVVGAKVAEPKVDIEADATVTWGIDLGTGGTISPQHGFKNEGNFKVKVPLIDKQTSTSKGEGKVYAEVAVEDIELYMQAKKGKNGDWVDGIGKKPPTTADDGGFDMFGSVGGLSAKFVFYGAYLQIFDKPGMKTNYANIWKPLDPKAADEYDATKHSDPFKFEPGFEGYGVKFGYMNKDLMDLDVGLKFVSNGSWEGYYEKTGTPLAPDGRHSKYGMGLDLSMKPLKDLLAFKLGVNATFADASSYKDTAGTKPFFGIGAEVTSKPVDGLALTLGFDGGTKNSDFLWDMLFDAKYKWVSTGLYVASKGTEMQSTDYSKSPNTHNANLAVYLKFETKGEDAKDPSFLLKGLDAGAYVGLYNLMSKKASNMNTTLPMLLKVWGSYKLALNDSMWIKPFATLWAETNHFTGSNTITPSSGAPSYQVGDPTTDHVFGIAYNLGVTFSPVEKVEITGKWAHGEADENNHPAYSQPDFKNVLSQTATNSFSQHNGTFTLAVKVKY